MDKRIRLGLIIPNRLYGEAFIALFDGSNVQPVFTAECLEDAPEGIDTVDVLLVDCLAQHKDVRQVVADIRNAATSAKIVTLSPNHRRSLLNAFLAGADGVVLPDISFQALNESLELVCTGERVYPSKLLTDLIDHPENANGRDGDAVREQGAALGLSRREIDVVEALADGLSNREIGERLNMKEGTVKVHLRHLSQHIGASNRTQIVLWALKNLPRPETEEDPAYDRPPPRGGGNENGPGS